MNNPEISVEELVVLATAAGGSLPLVDVREPGEWVDGHVSWATLVPLRTVPDHLDAFGADNAAEPTYVICKSGGRSHQACAFLAEHDKNVVNVSGGMLDWVRAGHDTVAGL